MSTATMDRLLQRYVSKAMILPMPTRTFVVTQKEHRMFLVVAAVIVVVCLYCHVLICKLVAVLFIPKEVLTPGNPKSPPNNNTKAQKK